MQKVLLVDDDIEVYRLIKNQFLDTPSLKDCDSKPFQAMKLVARIKSNLKDQGSDSNTLSKIDITIDSMSNRMIITELRDI